MNRKLLYRYFLHHPNICTDNRKVQPGDLFFALVGDKHDGNDYAALALEAGAAYAVVSRPELAQQDERYLYVPDTLRALQELAYTHRMNFTGPVIAITGTNGKTTTKELCDLVLKQKYEVLATEGNLNNHIGVPLTLLRLRPEHEVAIIEMGASAKGEIKLLAAIAQPTAGLITNIGKAHLEGFGSIEGVMEAKSELPEQLQKTGGDFFLNDDDERLRARWSDFARLKYGSHHSVDHPLDLLGKVLIDQPHLTVLVTGMGTQEMIPTSLTGRYNYQNVLAAATVGLYMGVPIANIRNAIASYAPNNNRSQIEQLHREINVIMDAYNANPTSMHEALENLSEAPEQHKYAILGDMLELGNATEEEHQAVLQWLRRHPEISALLCGKAFGALAPEEYPCFGTVEELIQHLQELRIPDDSCILVKGSRSIRLEKVFPALEDLALEGKSYEGRLWVSRHRTE